MPGICSLDMRVLNITTCTHRLQITSYLGQRWCRHRRYASVYHRLCPLTFLLLCSIGGMLSCYYVVARDTTPCLHSGIDTMRRAFPYIAPRFCSARPSLWFSCSLSPTLSQLAITTTTKPLFLPTQRSGQPLFARLHYSRPWPLRDAGKKN